MTLESKWWFRAGILCLAMFGADFLFFHVGISPREHGFFSGLYLIYLFCWFGFERFLSTTILLGLIFVKPELGL